MRHSHTNTVVPLENTTWWNNHVKYSKFRRQGIDIVCASFDHPKPKANLIFLTGLTESFIKYAEIIQFFYERRFSVHTYDHQSQGLSGRCKFNHNLISHLYPLLSQFFSSPTGLTESQSLWVNTFDDYVDDFVYFVTSISKDHPHLPVFVLAHSMGGFITTAAMARLPTLVSRAALCSPMLRMKCGVKAMDFKYPLPQTLTHWITTLSCYMGLGTYHALGYFKEKNTDKLSINVFTSDQAQLDKWMALRLSYPQLITTCVTNDWVLQSIRAQRRLATKYQFVKTNTLVLSAEHDYLVYNRAMAMFVKQAPHAKMLCAPGAYHEILCEKESIRQAALKVIFDFFSQKQDDVSLVFNYSFAEIRAVMRSDFLTGRCRPAHVRPIADSLCSDRRMICILRIGALRDRA
ncbi:alpha/beta hydrolase, partial [archaeon]